MLLSKFTKIRHHPTGFSLVEMAVVLVIVGLLLAGLLPTLSGQRNLKQINETRTQMEEIRESLTGFAVANGRLPCPDTDSTPDGFENLLAPPLPTGPGSSTRIIQCSGTGGGLPYNQLGTPALDLYNRAYIYRVTPTFAQKDEAYLGVTLLTTTYFKLSNDGNLRVCRTQACAAPRLLDNAAAVIVSQGEVAAHTPALSDETENADNDADFVSHDFAQGGFDDLVVWLSPNTLFNRMVAAGKLP